MMSLYLCHVDDGSQMNLIDIYGGQMEIDVYHGGHGDDGSQMNSIYFFRRYAPRDRRERKEDMTRLVS